MWKFVILAGLMAGIFLILYNSGYMIVKSLSAVTFIGSPKAPEQTLLPAAATSNGSFASKKVVHFIITLTQI